MSTPSSMWQRGGLPVQSPVQTTSEWKEFSKTYDGHSPVLVQGAVEWPAMTEWSRKRFTSAYREEMLVLTVTRKGLHNREVMVAPVHDLNFYQQNTSVEAWAMVEDELFLQLRPELLTAVPPILYTKENFFNHFPENCRPSNLTLIWSSAFARSVLRVASFNATLVHVLLSGRRTWKLFPPAQSRFLHLEQGGVTSGLGLQCRAYASPVDAFMPNSFVYPKFADAKPTVIQQHPGDVVIVPPGWFAQWISLSESVGTATPVLNKHNFEMVLSEIMKVRGQVNWNMLPLDLENLSAEEQIKLVSQNLAEAVHWRANITKSAMMMQFGRHLREHDTNENNQPLKMLQDAIMSNPKLLSMSGLALPPEGQQEGQQEGLCGPDGASTSPLRQVMKDASSSIQALYSEPQTLLEALGLNTPTVNGVY